MENYPIVLKEKGQIALRGRYIVPFEIKTENRDFESVCKCVDEYEDDLYAFLGKSSDKPKMKWVRESLKNGEQDIYAYVRDEFAFTNEIEPGQQIKKIGCFWRYTSPEKEPFRFRLYFSPDKKSDVLTEMAISDMGLYLFRSGVGFIWYEIALDAQGMKDSISLIHFQNVFKELNRHRGEKCFLQVKATDFPTVSGCETKEYIPFLLGNWIAERLRFLDVKYQARRDNEYVDVLKKHFLSKTEESEKAQCIDRWKSILPRWCPDKSIIFVYAAFDRKADWKMDDDAIKTAYYLTNGYKESYEMNEETKKSIKCPFSNVIWMATKEGCGYFAWPGETNTQFFAANQYGKIMNDYFLLYIRALYQSYSLLKYAEEAVETLPSDREEYRSISEDAENLSEKISKLVTEINLFLVKSVAVSVSHIQHQNEFYIYVCDQLKIKDDVKSVTAGLEALDDIHQRAVQEKQREEQAEAERREKEADDDFQTGLGLLTVLVIISAVADSFGIVSAIRENDFLPYQWIFFALLVIGCAVVGFFSLRLLFRSLRKKSGKKKKQ